MPAFIIDDHIAGAKTLWILRFAPSLDAPAKPKIEFLIPTPFNKNEWMVVNHDLDTDWLKCLVQFQQMCEDAKTRCIQQKNTPEAPIEEKAKKANDEILNFSALVRYFNEILRYLNPKDPNEPPIKD